MKPVGKGQHDELAVRLRKLREQSGLSQARLAAQCKISQASYSRMEAGLTEPSLGSLRAIATGLGIPMRDLFTEELNTAFTSTLGMEAVNDTVKVALKEMHKLKISVENTIERLEKLL